MGLKKIISLWSLKSSCWRRRFRWRRIWRTLKRNLKVRIVLRRGRWWMWWFSFFAWGISWWALEWLNEKKNASKSTTAIPEQTKIQNRRWYLIAEILKEQLCLITNYHKMKNCEALNNVGAKPPPRCCDWRINYCDSSSRRATKTKTIPSNEHKTRLIHYSGRTQETTFE